MGRLLESLLADSQAVPLATPATLRHFPAATPPKVAESQESQGAAPARTPQSRRVAEVAGRGAAETTPGQRARLLALAADEGLPAGLVHGLADADAVACDGLPDDVLRAYLHALEAGRRMDAGMVPPGWGDAVARTCEGCGPVLLWPGCPAKVKACPWCFRRKAGNPIPRPLVACGECRHFLPDTMNPEAGMGGCELGPGRAYWPMKRHCCTSWEHSTAIAQARARV